LFGIVLREEKKVENHCPITCHEDAWEEEVLLYSYTVSALEGG
jgi:hypothetical protein